MNTTIGVQKAQVRNVPQIERQGNLPEKQFRAGAISATVWLNKAQKTTGEEAEYRTIALERAYTDKEGKWQSTNSFRVNDLPKAALVMQRAYEFLVLGEQDLFKRGD